MLFSDRHMDIDRILAEAEQMIASGHIAKARNMYKMLVDHNPDVSIAHYNLGVTYHKEGLLTQAIDAYGQAIRLDPTLTQAQFNLAHAYWDLHDFERAISAYRRILEIEPHNASAAYHLGNIYKGSGNFPRALEMYQRAVKNDPEFVEAWNNMGVIFRDDDKLDQASKCFGNALAISPDFHQALYNMGIVHQKAGGYEEGLSFFQRALSAAPDYAPAKWLYHLSLPIFYENANQIKTARERFTAFSERLVQSTSVNTLSEKQRAFEGISSTTNFFLQYQGENDIQLQQQYGRFVVDVMSANFPQWTTAPKMPELENGQKIRLGYVSSLMRAHTIGLFLLGWLKHHNRQNFELYCYHVGFKTDSMTQKIIEVTDHFVQYDGRIETMAGRIKSDNLHLLIHTDVGMDPVTTQLAGLRLAPVQCKGWGHPVTTGLPTIDYYLSSDLMEPVDAQSHYTEKLIRLPNLALAYDPPVLPSRPTSKLELGLPENRFIFLSNQSLFKYLPQYDVVFPAIAERLPNATFVFIGHQSRSVTELFRNRLQKSFEAKGLDAAQLCIFLPRLSHSEFLSLNLCSDVYLDTPGWSGGKTTLEALSCDLPVVTWPGAFMRARHAYAMLKRIGLEGTIAGSLSEYIEIAVLLATDNDYYKRTKDWIKLHKHLLYRDKEFISELESFYSSTVISKQKRKDVPLTKDCHRQLVEEKFEHVFEKAALLHEQGRYPEAITVYLQAISIDPMSAEAHYNLGLIYSKLEQKKKAAENFEKAHALRTDWQDALFNLGKVLDSDDRIFEASMAYEKLISINPNHGKALNNLGTIKLKIKTPQEAVFYFQQATRHLVPPTLALNNLGKAYEALKQNDMALEAYRKACELDPDSAEAWFNMGQLQTVTGQLDDAVFSFSNAILHRPDMGEAHNNIGNVYKRLGNYPLAAESYKRALHLQPQLPEVHYNLGSVLRMDEKYHEALSALSNAIKLNPEYADAWNNLALTCKNIGELDRALLYFSKAIELAPDFSIAHWNRSFVYFLLDDPQNGWSDFEWRFAIPQWKSIYPFRMNGRRWDGQSVPGKTIFVHDEQGLGDTIMFARYLPFLRSKCEKIIFETRPELVPILQNNIDADELTLRGSGTPDPSTYDFYVPLMSLPGIAHAQEYAIPNQVPYLGIDHEVKAKWDNVFDTALPKIGLVWAGRPEHANDRNRSCPLEYFTPLLDRSDLYFVSLQKGSAAAQLEVIGQNGNVMDLGNRLSSFADTAAVISQLDLVITVDTSVAHLAGALGARVWVLLPFIPDWRWGMKTTQTVWYPTMRLFRQKRPRHWDTVIDEIVKALGKQLSHDNLQNALCSDSLINEGKHHAHKPLCPY